MGPLHFTGESGRLECDYCGSSFNTAEIEALYGEKEANAVEAAQNAAEAEQAIADGSDWDTSGLSEDWGADAGSIKAYCCPSCGAELLCDATTAATSCPYCGNPSVLPGQFSGILKPDFVLPFKLSKEDAIKALKKHYLKKPLLPSTFSKANHLEEIKGVYVPFWMYDGEASGSAQFHATQVHTYTSGDYEITETSHYDVRRAGSIAFEKIPVDASSKMPDDYMDSIEPYDYAELRPFSTAYLPGFLADKYDVSVEDSRNRADRRCAGSLADALETALPAMDDTAFAVAQQWKDMDCYDFAGSGFEYACAFFGQAKVFEAIGRQAMYINTEEWLHLNFFVNHPEKIGTMIWAAEDNKADSRTLETIGYAKQLGRPLAIVTDREMPDETQAAVFVIPKAKNVLAESLYNFVPACLVFGYLMTMLGERSGRGCEGPWSFSKGAACVRQSEIVMVDD